VPLEGKKMKSFFGKMKTVAIAGAGVAVAASPALATSAGDYTDITSYATTTVPLAAAAIIGCMVLVLGLALAGGVTKKIKHLLSGL
jgi:hypothetical protein